MATLSKNQKIVAATLTFGLSLYTGAGFYGLPYFLMDKLPAIVQNATGLQLQIQSARFNPFNFNLAIDGCSLTEANTGLLFKFESFTINFSATDSIWQRAVVFDSISLNQPQVNIKRLANGSFNFSHVMAKKDSAPPPEQHKTEILPLAIHQLTISEGHATWQDESTGQAQTETLLPINISIADFTTQLDKDAHFDLGFTLESGGQLQWTGQLNLRQSLSTGHIALQDLALPKLWQLFLQKNIPIVLNTGTLNLQADYHASFGEATPQVQINHGELAINQIAISDKSQKQPLITLPQIQVQGIEADLGKHAVQIGGISSHDAVIKASLLKDGRLNYQALFTPATNANPAAAPNSTPASDSVSATAPDSAPATTTAAPPVATAVADNHPAPAAWQLAVDGLTLSNYQLLFSDLTLSKPQQFKLSAINVNLGKWSNSPQAPALPVKINATFNDLGKLGLSGSLNTAPLAGKLTLDIKSIKFKTFQAYLDDFANLELVDGEFNSTGTLQIQTTDSTQVMYQGDADIANLLTRDKLAHKDFLKWSDLQFQQIAVDTGKQTYALANVVFDHPYLRVNINKDRTTNFADLLVTHQAKTDTPAPAAKASKADNPPAANQGNQPLITIGKILFKSGHSDFADNSLILPFVADMDDLDGSINGYSSQQDSAVKLVLQGKVYNLAQVTVKGSYQISNGNSDISLNFSHMPLPLITPYMADFAGYKIEKGQMALDLLYKINQGQLDAQNKIFIDQLTLGDQVENPHATSLPLHLAIALLKDADGKINLDFPITGSLNDPQFSIGTLITDVLGNLIEKLVQSPFKALGSLLNSDDNDYSAVAFVAGKTDLKPEEATKLEQLGKALQNKPELVLNIKGTANQAQDWPELRFDAVKEVLRKMKSGELSDKGEKIRSEYIELSDGDYKRLLAKFYKEVFPQDFESTLLGGPRIKSQPDAEFYETALQKLEAAMPPEPQRLNDLAIARANSIAKYLIEKTGLNIERIYFLATETDNDSNKAPSTVLSLNVAHE